MNKTTIENRISEIKKELIKTEKMRPGSLSQQSRKSKGRYYQLSYTYENKGRTEYIRTEFADDIKTQIKNYGNFKSLINEWIMLSIEESKLGMKLKKKSG